MTSSGKAFNCFLLSVLLSGAACKTIHQDAAPTEPQWLNTEEKILTIDSEIARICQETLGYAYPLNEISYREQPSSRIWILTTIGKHGLITSAVAVHRGVISHIQILSDHERRGRQISSSAFLKQFAGNTLSTSLELSTSIDGITGATKSSQAIEDAATLALRLDATQNAPTLP